MSQSRQLRTFALDVPDGYSTTQHAHAWGQLVFVVGGVVTVLAGTGAYVAPTNRAVWIPSGVEHSLLARGPTQLRTIYRPAGLGQGLRVIGVSELLRSLILRCIEIGIVEPEDAARDALITLVDHEIERATPFEGRVPLPTDPRALAVAHALLGESAPERTVEAWADEAGVSVRTLQRLFSRDTGLSFGQWCLHVRMLEAVRRLSAGEAVGDVALACGYRSASAFVAAFRRVYGFTPGGLTRGSRDGSRPRAASSLGTATAEPP